MVKKSQPIGDYAPRLSASLARSGGIVKKIIAAQSILVASDFDLQIFMQWIVDEMQIITPATGAIVEFVDGDEMVYRAVAGSASSHNGMRIKMKGSISGLCISTNTTLLLSDTEDDPRVDVEACRQLSARSLVAAPLHHENETLGVLKIISNKASEFTLSHEQILQIMAGLIAAGLKHQRLISDNYNYPLVLPHLKIILLADCCLIQNHTRFKKN